MRRSLYYCFS